MSKLGSSIRKLGVCAIREGRCRSGRWRGIGREVVNWGHKEGRSAGTGGDLSTRRGRGRREIVEVGYSDCLLWSGG